MQMIYNRIVCTTEEYKHLLAAKQAWETWQDKTDWIQGNAPAWSLGMHRADVMKEMIENLEKEVQRQNVTIQQLAVKNAELMWEKRYG
jgi:hypothetical protein